MVVVLRQRHLRLLGMAREPIAEGLRAHSNKLRGLLEGQLAPQRLIVGILRQKVSQQYLLFNVPTVSRAAGRLGQGGHGHVYCCGSYLRLPRLVLRGFVFLFIGRLSPCYWLWLHAIASHAENA